MGSVKLERLLKSQLQIPIQNDFLEASWFKLCAILQHCSKGSQEMLKARSEGRSGKTRSCFSQIYKMGRRQTSSQSRNIIGRKDGIRNAAHPKKIVVEL